MNEGFSKPASVADVARAAGVAKATAARVLGGYGTVSTKTREAVEAAAARLGYRPNELARSMTTGRTGTVGVVVGDIGNPFFSLAVRGISDRLREAGIGVILANSGEEVEEEREAIRRLLAWRVDGIIVSPASVTDTAHIAEAMAAGVAVTLLDREVTGLGADCATTDDTGAALGVTEELIRRGHQSLAYVTSSLPDHGQFSGPQSIRTGAVRKRIEAFLSSCTTHRKAASVLTGASDDTATAQLITESMSGPNPPDAFIASDSLIGISVFRTLRERGCAIGHEVSLVTFHDADWTRITEPPVAVVCQPASAMGEAAAELMVARLAAPGAAPRHVAIPTSFVWRDSVSRGLHRP